MPQDVMAHLMPENQHELRCCELLNRCIPNHHPLSSSKARDVSVGPSQLGTGLHDEHPVGWDVESAMLRDSLKSLDEFGIFGRQWLALVEQRVDSDGRNKRQKRRNRDDCQPEIEPPPALAARDNQVEDPNDNCSHC